MSDVTEGAMRSPGLIALDFDGTLLRSDSTVSARTISILSKARQQGWLVVGATGRPPDLARAVYREVPPLTHVVCNNGTLTWKLAEDGEVVLDEHSMSEEAAHWAVSVVRGYAPDARFVMDQVSGAQTWEAGFELLVSNAPLGEMVPDAPSTISGPVRKVIAWSPSVHHEVLLTELYPLLHPRLEPTHAGLAFVEIGPTGVSKASALAVIAQSLPAGAPTVAFGDAPNDHEMLEWAGQGVAMANAHPETLQIADHVTVSNDEDGVAVHLEQLLD